MSCTFTTIDQALSIDRYPELSLCFEMIDTVSSSHRYSSFRNGSAISNGVVIEVRIDVILLFVMIFSFLVGAIVREHLIFFVSIPLPDGSIVNFVFIRDISGYSLEEGVLV